MVKKIVIAGGAVLLLLGLLFDRDVFSYAKTSLSWVRSSTRDAIPVSFELERARRMIKDLDPQIRRNMEVIAAREIELADYKKQLTDTDAVLAKGKGEILRLTGDLQRGDTTFVYAGRNYSMKQVEDDLRQRVDRYKGTEEFATKLRKIVAARESGVAAASEKLKAMQSARSQLEIEVANLEARLEMVRVAEASSAINVDDSQLARTKDLLKTIGSRIEVAEKLVAAEVKYPSQIDLEEHTNSSITEEVARLFGSDSTNVVKLD